MECLGLPAVLFFHRLVTNCIKVPCISKNCTRYTNAEKGNDIKFSYFYTTKCHLKASYLYEYNHFQTYLSATNNKLDAL